MIRANRLVGALIDVSWLLAAWFCPITVYGQPIQNMTPICEYQGTVVSCKTHEQDPLPQASLETQHHHPPQHIYLGSTPPYTNFYYWEWRSIGTSALTSSITASPTNALYLDVCDVYTPHIIFRYFFYGFWYGPGYQLRLLLPEPFEVSQVSCLALPYLYDYYFPQLDFHALVQNYPGPSPSRTPWIPPSTPTFTATPPNSRGTPTPSPTATPRTLRCPCDCNDNDQVTVDELITAVNITLGQAAVESCPAADVRNDGQVTVDDILLGVRASLNGCPQRPSSIQVNPK